MNVPSGQDPGSVPQPPKTRGGTLGRVARLARKELRETLRDRRTIITLVLMPLLVYPLLSVAFQRFLLSRLHPASEVVYRIGVESEEAAQLVLPYLYRGEALLAEQSPMEGSVRTPVRPQDREAEEGDAQAQELPVEFFVRSDLEESVAQLDDDVGLRVHRLDEADPLPRGEPPLDCELLFLENSVTGREAAEFVERRLRAVNDEVLDRQLRELGITERMVAVQAIRKPVEPADRPGAFELSAVIPLILILMTITGAVYPAIDLTAGERERGTLEMLIAAPVPRLGLLLAKYVAVMTVALLTATVNLVAMTVTILSIGLGPLLFGEEGLSAVVVALVFGLLILFAAFFSAVLLAVTSFARSFKEAQAYLIPLMLVSIAPGLLSTIPGVRLSGILAVTPLLNIVLLARDLLEGSADPAIAAVVIASTVLFALVAIAAAARIFGTDAILYGSQDSWSSLFRRPPQPLAVPSLSGALVCLALLFPAYFLLGNLLARWEEATMAARLGLSALITAVLFGGFPLAAAWINRVRLRDGFRLKPVAPLAFFAALLLGLSLWPFAYEIVILKRELGLTALDTAFHERITALLAEWKELSPLWILLTLAVAPAVFEEFFFRGYLLGALRARARAWNAILLSGLLFGLFHLIATDSLSFARFVPSTFLGIVLGWVCLRTGSVFPGMLMHACHNGFLLMVSYYQEELAARGWGVEQESHLPGSWLLGAAVGAGLGLALIVLSGRRGTEP